MSHFTFTKKEKASCFKTSHHFGIEITKFCFANNSCINLFIVLTLIETPKYNCVRICQLVENLL